MTLWKEKKSSMIYLLIGVFFAALIFVNVPTKLIFLMLVGSVGAIFTFFALEISFGLFIVCMSIIPHEYWNNILIFGAAVLYGFVFLLQVLMGKRKGISIQQISVPLLFFVFFACYSLFITTEFSDSLRIFLFLFSSIVISVLMIGILADRQSLNRTLDFICIAVFFTCLYGLYQKVTGIEIRAEFIDAIASAGMPARIFSTMDNPNNYAEYLVLLLPLCFSHFLNTKDELKKMIVLGITMLGVVLLILTLSRSAYLAFMIGCAVYVFLLNRKIIPFFVILAIACVPFLPSFMIDRFMSMGKDTSTQYRFLIWNGVFMVLKDYWIQGIGMGPVVFRKMYGAYANITLTPAMHSHNLMLQILLEMGIGGFLSFVFLLLSNMKNNFMAYLKTTDPYYKNLLAAFIFSVVSITVFSSGEHVWFYPRVMLTFWIVLGLSFSTINLAGEQQ